MGDEYLWIVMEHCGGGRGSHSFPFQPNLSSSVHHITQLES